MSPDSASHSSRAQQFLSQAPQFQLGALPTESRHPRTTRLSQLSLENLEAAIDLLKDVELEALNCLKGRDRDLDQMAEEIRATLDGGGRIFLGGCGATGRLSLSLETIWREEVARRGRHELAEKVISFMAGGDYALVRSIENFEDHPEYGARQLLDLGFGPEDLMIGCTEGGETPWVIGAVEQAAEISRRSPYFVYCNPTELLRKTTERSRRVIDNRYIRSIAYETGPMAVAGSTRMQATSVLQLAVGAAMFAFLEPEVKPSDIVDRHVRALRETDLKGLAPFIREEAETYAAGNYCVHRTSAYAITILTDTTERSPTFSLRQFENDLEKDTNLSWSYLCHPLSKGSNDSWSKVLRREPRGLDWASFRERFGQAALLGFDFSPTTLERRVRVAGTSQKQVRVFDIEPEGKSILLKFGNHEARLPRPENLLSEHLLLKCAFNAGSTLVMGRLGRFSGNLMLYVRASNMKLIDRAIRYVRILLEESGINGCTYEEVCLALFEIRETLGPDDPIVLRTFELCRNRHYSKRGA